MAPIMTGEDRYHDTRIEWAPELRHEQWKWQNIQEQIGAEKSMELRQTHGVAMFSLCTVYLSGHHQRVPA